MKSLSKQKQKTQQEEHNKYLLEFQQKVYKILSHILCIHVYIER